MRTAILALALLTAAPAFAQSDDPARLARVSARLERLEGLRAAKRLQIAYANYSQFGLWDEMAALFARDAVLEYGQDRVRGRTAIARYFKEKFGGGKQGLQPGQLHTQLLLDPVVTVAADGRSAKGRWHEVSMLGGGDDAHWAGGIQENEYRLEDGVWKIARLHHHAMYAGTYADGWRNLEADLKPVAYHFTPDEAGAPITLPADAKPAMPRTAAAVERRLARMRDEDLVRNLQHAYGYYIDQKLWNDVTDLFAPDGEVEVAGVGIWRGKRGIRRWLEQNGPGGLRRGEVNEHLQLDTAITIAPDGQEAWARGLDFGMLGRNHQWGLWTQAVFYTHFVKQGGLWRMQSVRLVPTLRSDYYQGWGKSRMAEPTVAKGYDPDRPSSLPPVDPQGRIVPAFNFPNPATARAVAYPAGLAVLGADPAVFAAASAPIGEGDSAVSLSELERRLAVEEAYDATENVSSAFGDYLDVFDWDNSSALFARTGRRNKYQIGFYIGPDRIKTAEITQYGRPKSPRTSVQVHLRTQPVIDVAEDGRTTKLRTRLFSFNSSRDVAGNFQSGMYPNDRMVLQDGVWKFQHQSIDELYFTSAGYKGGWADVPDARPSPTGPSIIMKLATQFPPDIWGRDMGPRYRGFAFGPDFIDFPDVKPMWFHYLNPVSGRVPPNYCPDESTCYQLKPLFKDQ